MAFPLPWQETVQLRGKNKDMMRKAQFSEFISKYLQQCSLRDNESILQLLYNKIENENQKKEKLLGLMVADVGFDFLYSHLPLFTIGLV